MPSRGYCVSSRKNRHSPTVSLVRLRWPHRMNSEEVNIPEWGREDEAEEVRGTARTARRNIEKVGWYFGLFQNFTTATEPNPTIITRLRLKSLKFSHDERPTGRQQQVATFVDQHCSTRRLFAILVDFLQLEKKFMTDFLMRNSQFLKLKCCHFCKKFEDNFISSTFSEFSWGMNYRHTRA